MEEHATNLTEPSAQNLITISGCDASTVRSLSETDLKQKVFGAFKSISRVLKRGDKVIIEMEDMAEAEKLESEFPGLRVPALGGNAHIDLEAENESNFAKLWIEQHHGESEKKTEEQHKVLHEEIIPRLNKMTSMETDFLGAQNKEEIKVGGGHFGDITEQSSEHLHTRNELPEEKQEFLMGE